MGVALRSRAISTPKKSPVGLGLLGLSSCHTSGDENAPYFTRDGGKSQIESLATLRRLEPVCRHTLNRKKGRRLTGSGRIWWLVARSISYFMQIGGVRFCGFYGIIAVTICFSSCLWRDPGCENAMHSNVWRLCASFVCRCVWWAPWIAVHRSGFEGCGKIGAHLW